MIGLDAIRRDHDPIQSPRTLLRVIRWTTYQCPLCRRTFKIAWGPESVLLGPGQRTCKGCGTVFKDGSMEWPKLTRIEKQQYLFPVSVIGVFGGLLVVCIVTLLFPLFLPNAGQSVDWKVAAACASFAVAVFGFWFLTRCLEIARSRERHRQHEVNANV